MSVPGASNYGEPYLLPVHGSAHGSHSPCPVSACTDQRHSLGYGFPGPHSHCAVCVAYVQHIVACMQGQPEEFIQIKLASLIRYIYFSFIQIYYPKGVIKNLCTTSPTLLVS